MPVSRSWTRRSEPQGSRAWTAVRPGTAGRERSLIPAPTRRPWWRPRDAKRARAVRVRHPWTVCRTPDRRTPVGRTRYLPVDAARPAPLGHLAPTRRSTNREQRMDRFHVKHCFRRTHAPSCPWLIGIGRPRERSQWHRLAMRAVRRETARRPPNPPPGPHYRRAASLRPRGNPCHACPPDESPPDVRKTR